MWPEVLATLRKAQIVGALNAQWDGISSHDTDYSIHFFEPHHLLIAHMRYVGPPGVFQARMDAIKDDAKTREWWQVRILRLGDQSRVMS